MGSINYFDYKLLVEETVRNYCANLGFLYPSNFKKMESIFFNNILKKYNLWYSDVVNDNTGDAPIFIINIRTIVNRMLEFISYNDVQYNNKSIYNYKWLPIKNTYSMFKKLHVIYEHGGIDAIYNLIEIYNQTYLVGDNEIDNQGLTSVLFIYDQKGDLQNYNYSPDFPFVLYDNKLGDFLGIPVIYWNKIRGFTLDCRSDMFLEIMKRWKSILLAIQPCSNKYFNQCMREYRRTHEPMVIWGSCPKFNEKVETLKSSTILFKKDTKWEKEYDGFKNALNY
jgi:hypothetical protein